MNNKFVHLHCHGDGSLLDSGIKVKTLVKKIVELKDMSAIAITDHGTLINSFKFYSEAKEKGIKPILGMEAYLHYDINNIKEETGRSHITLLAMNKEGWKNLLKLHTISYKDHFYRKPQIDYKLLTQHNEGLIVLSGCMAGHLHKCVRNNDMKQAIEIASFMKKTFGDRYYIELQRIGLDINDNYGDKLIDIAQSLKIKVAATNDVHFLERDHHKIHGILCSISMGNKMHEYPKELYLKSGEEMQEVFSDIPEAIESTLEIAERCNVDPNEKKMHIPSYINFIPDKFKMDTEEDTQNNYLYQIVRKRYTKILGPEKANNPIYKERVKKELNSIFSMGYSSYFLIVHDFINWCIENDIPVGPGRGSSAGSLVCYILNITFVDPIEADLIFERFLNEGRRDSPPDIDTDIDDEDRMKVVEYVFNKYGNERCSLVGTFGTMGVKSLIKDVCRVLKIPISIADELSKSVPEYTVNRTTMEMAISDSPKFAKMYEESKSDEKLSLMFKFMKEFEGAKRQMGKHAAGVVIGPSEEPLDDFMPLFFDRDAKRFTSGVDKDDVEKAGLMKMDFLGLKTVKQIKEIVDMTNAFSGGYFEFMRYIVEVTKLKDDKIVDMIFKNQFMLGIFQFEFESMQGYAKQLGITEFEDLVIITSAGRPGVKDFIPYMSQCKNGTKEPKYDDKRLEPVLKNTWGVILYQEQAIQLFKTMANFTLVEADLARRAIGKKKAEIMEKLKADFVNGSIKNGYSDTTANSVFEKISLHAGYCLSGETDIELVLSSKNYEPEIYRIDYLYNVMNSLDYAIKVKALDLRKKLKNQINRWCISIDKDNVGRPRKFLEIVQRGVKECYKFTFQSGIELISTLDHVILTVNGLKRIEEVNLEDLVYKDMGYSQPKYKLSKSRYNNVRTIGYDRLLYCKSVGPRMTYDVVMEDQESPYFAANTLMVHNSFNRSHAYAYSIISWMTAYLKTYYTAEFMAVIMSGAGSNMLKKYIEECKRLEIGILPPCVQHSKSKFVNEIYNDSEYKKYSYYKESYGSFGYKNGQKCIRYGTSQINGVSENYDYSEHGPYNDIQDFIRKNPTVNSKSFSHLAYAGALDCFGIKRSTLIENLEPLLKGSKANKTHEDQETLFDDEEVSLTLMQPKEEWSLKQLFINEMEVTRHCFIVDFQTAFKDEINKLAGGKTISDFTSVTSKIPALCVGMVYTKKWHRDKKNNKNMMFLTIGDFESKIEVSVFEDALLRTAAANNDEVSEGLIKDKDVILVDGMVSGNGKGITARVITKIDITKGKK